MIKTLSPHYISVPWLSPSSGTIPDSYVLEIYLWDGLKASVPVEAKYELERVNPLGKVGETGIDISNYVNDLLDISLVSGVATGLLNADSQIWVKTQVIYTIGGVEQSPEFELTQLAVRGYTGGMEGKNASTPVNNILAYGEEVKANRQGVFCLPVLVSETVTTDIILTSETVVLNFSKTATTTSGELVQLIWLELSEFGSTDSYVEIQVGGVLVYTVLIEDELRYTPIDVIFL